MIIFGASPQTNDILMYSSQNSTSCSSNLSIYLIFTCLEKIKHSILQSLICNKIIHIVIVHNPSPLPGKAHWDWEKLVTRKGGLVHHHHHRPGDTWRGVGEAQGPARLSRRRWNSSWRLKVKAGGPCEGQGRGLEVSSGPRGTPWVRTGPPCSGRPLGKASGPSKAELNLPQTQATCEPLLFLCRHLFVVAQ